MSAHCRPLALPRFLHLIAQHCLSHYMSAHPPTLPRFLCVNTAMYRLHHYPHLIAATPTDVPQCHLSALPRFLCNSAHQRSLSQIILQLSLASYASAPITVPPMSAYCHCHPSAPPRFLHINVCYRSASHHFPTYQHPSVPLPPYVCLLFRLICLSLSSFGSPSLPTLLFNKKDDY
jgi:hypothetical protein